MNRIGKSFSLAILVGALATTAAWAQDCKPAHIFTTVAAGKLTVAIYEYPPFTTASSDGATIGGVDSDVVKAFAAANCLAVVFEWPGHRSREDVESLFGQGAEVWFRKIEILR